MSAFNPGDGWRRASDEEAQSGGTEAVMHFSLKSGWTNWVREEPVPALPTEPYTVIRVTGRGDARTDLDDDRWFTTTGQNWTSIPAIYGQPSHIFRDRLRERIASFEVLSEPRAVTAKAVLDRVSEMWTGDERIWDIAREFGVS